MSEKALLTSRNYRDTNLLRWRLILGDEDKQEPELDEPLSDIDEALEVLYSDDGIESELCEDDIQSLDAPPGAGETDLQDERSGGLEKSAPFVARWLADVREFFPTSIVQVLQKDAIEKFDLPLLLLEPEMMEIAKADVSTLATIISLKDLIPGESKANARILVERIVEDIMKRLSDPLEQKIRGAINRSTRIRNPRDFHDINFFSTIKANLHNYVKELNTVIPENLIGYGRHAGQHKKSIHLLIDQSASMANSIIYAGIYGSVLSSISTIDTRVVGFDTTVLDLTEKLSDPVDLLFGINIGGGTDINNAVAYSQQMITSPTDTTLVIITDLYEGGDSKELLNRIGQLVGDGVNVIVLLALNDQGAPSYDQQLANKVRNFDVPVFACSPEQFPEVMASALEGRDLDISD